MADKNKTDAIETAAAKETGKPEVKSSTSQKHHMLSLNVSAGRVALKEKLEAAATRLGCGVTSLAWYGIEQMLLNPPKVAPASVARAVGSALGFSVVHTIANGRCTQVKIVEGHRNLVEVDATHIMRQFSRYDKGNEKSRGRALKQAMTAAKYDHMLAGVKEPTTGVLVETIEGDDGDDD